jgi:hypothetical protein
MVGEVTGNVDSLLAFSNAKGVRESKGWEVVRCSEYFVQATCLFIGWCKEKKGALNAYMAYNIDGQVD